MKAKALEIRDRHTFIPALAVDMNPGPPAPDGGMSLDELARHLADQVGRMYLLRRAGYACDGEPIIMLTRMAGGLRAFYDPYDWCDRTWTTAHNYIVEHWNELRDGDVIDVEFILGESTQPKVSERVA
jgi:hypothetical protein